jgi:hypothetical protein
MKNYIAIFAAGIMLLTLSGCYSGYSFKKTPVDSEVVHVSAATPAGSPATVYIESVKVDSRQVNDPDVIRGKLAKRLEETGLFSVVSDKPVGQYIDINLEIKNKPLRFLDFVIRSTVIAGSLFLLSPVMPYNWDLDAAYRTDVAWINGEHSAYEVTAVVSGYATVSEAGAAFDAATGQLAEACITSLVNQFSAAYQNRK